MALFDTQHPWAFAFGLLGNLVSFMVFLAPVPTFYRIYKKKSTEGFRSLPYLVALFSCMMWLYYAMLKKDVVLLVTINSFGCVVETIYISMFIAYAAKEARNFTIRLFLAMNVAFFSMIILFCYFALEGSTRVEVLGWINVAIAVSVFAAPLSIIAQVIRTKSVEFMPFNLSFFLTLSAVMWFAYGMLKHDKCVAIPNVLGFLFGVVQMVLYAMYRNNDNKVVEGKKLQPENIKGAVVLGTLGNGDLGHADDANKPQDIIIDIVNQDAKKNEEKTKQGHEISKEASHDGSKPNDEAV